MNKKIFYGSLIIIFIDQLVKVIISSTMAINSSITVIKDFLYITYVNNDGVAFSMLSNQRFIIILISLIALVVIYRYMFTFKLNKKNTLGFCFIFGGIIGNLIDRVLLSYVRDFIDMRFGSYQYPVFNIADMAIVVGVVLLIIAILKKEDCKK